MAFVAQPVEQFKCGHFIDGSAGKPFTKVPCPRCGAKVKVPAAFDHFLIHDCLGRGATGYVFRAFDTRLRREVAIKVLTRSAEELGREVGEQILAEARTLASLSHDNVVNIYSLGEHLDQSCIVMEMLSGGTAKHKYRDDRTHGVVGTPYYVAPEVATSKPADFRSDMYSLGASLFHLLTGARA